MTNEKNTDLSNFFKGGFDATKYIKKPTPWGAENPRADFITTMRQHGYRPDNMLSLGQVTRIPDSQDKGHDKTGWYVYFEIENQGSDSTFGVGVFGSWRDPDSKTRWSSKQESYKTDVEKELEALKMAKYMAERERDRADLQRVAAEAAKQAFDSADPANLKHEYLVKKNIKPFGIKQRDGHLLIPMYDDNGEMISYQSISADGTKRFKKDAKKKGGFFPIDGAKDVIFITTGFATGTTIAEATGMMTFVAFDDGNLPEVASAVRARYGLSQRIVVAADDDVGKPHNSGRTAGTKTAILINAEVKFPTTPTDFNDMAQAEGIKAVRDLLLAAPIAPESEKKLARPKGTADRDMALNPSGALGMIAGYINATATRPQPMFSVQAAIAFCSVVLGRSYRTDQNNMASLFLMNIAGSGRGKGHPLKAVKKLLRDVDMRGLQSGSGYSSANAVFTALMVAPKHISLIDEFGKYLEAMNASAGGWQIGANSALMQVITEQDGGFSLGNYSGGGGVTREKANEFVGKEIICPSITLLAAATPDTLFDSINGKSIRDGFLNRFIIAISDQPRTKPMRTERIETPKPIIDWTTAVTQRAGNQIHVWSEQPSFVDVKFTEDCWPALEAIYDFCTHEQEYLEAFKITEMAERLQEIAMRLSLIAALSDDPYADYVEPKHVEWAWNYVQLHYLGIIAEIKMRVSGSRYEADKKLILSELRKLKDGIKQSEMPKTPPFSQYKKKDLVEMLGELSEAGLIESVDVVGPKGGNAARLWRSYDPEAV